jgi:Zn-dependent metalloprotease
VSRFIPASFILERVVSENVKVELLMKYEEVKKKGKTHMKYVSGKAKIQPGSVFFRFENLFNGDKILGEQINTVINENWKVFYEDMEETFEEVVMQIVINMVNKFFAKVSIEEAFD